MDTNIDIFNYRRRNTTPIHVGDLQIGGDAPVRVQSMTTTNTNDTAACVAQAKRIIDAGGELVRLTTQGRREAENLANISTALRADGYTTPLVADVHFNANVADTAARYAEKVRINPGNYVDPARVFKKIDYTDEEYAAELRKIEERLVPFIHICREHHTAVRIGVNHGSLSDRIMSRYGDTPEGIVESCMEFLRIFRREHFDDVVISIKASNTVVMVRSVRLLIDTMDKEEMYYPIHLGVTEAGEGEDGRIKSAVGIGALLTDGIGDTIRVSLSEDPEAEIPVARQLVDYIATRERHRIIPAIPAPYFDWIAPVRRTTRPVLGIGGDNVPAVIATLPANTNPEYHPDTTPDYLYTGATLPEERIPGCRYIVDFNAWKGEADTYPIYPTAAMPFIAASEAPLKFLVLQYGSPTEEYFACLRHHPEVVVVGLTQHQNRPGEMRALAQEIAEAGLTNPIIFALPYRHKAEEKAALQLEAAADTGAPLIDGLADGLWIMNDGDITPRDLSDTTFAILQAARLRTSRTEYISCPGCGRTLYDLRTTIARIKAATAHMRGLKIGIMGCIVNGPGEMADADYGYVGAGPHRISLYRRKECVEKAIPEEEAVEHLLALIEADKKEEK